MYLLPELPEVETVSRGLKFKIVGKKFLNINNFVKIWDGLFLHVWKN